MSHVIGLTPFGFPDVKLAYAVHRAGALSVLDLGRDADTAREALGELERSELSGFGVRLVSGLELVPDELPSQVETVVVPAGESLESWGAHTTLVQASPLTEARTAA
ncbi:MAG: hypothetical protein ACR2OD_03995, partial [Gaiellaceae bacterium]